MESCQDHELTNLVKVEPVPAEQGVILIKANRIIFVFLSFFFFIAHPSSNITVGRKVLHERGSLLFLS